MARFALKSGDALVVVSGASSRETAPAVGLFRVVSVSTLKGYGAEPWTTIRRERVAGRERALPLTDNARESVKEIERLAERARLVRVFRGASQNESVNADALRVYESAAAIVKARETALAEAFIRARNLNEAISAEAFAALWEHDAPPAVADTSSIEERLGVL